MPPSVLAGVLRDPVWITPRNTDLDGARTVSWSSSITALGMAAFTARTAAALEGMLATGADIVYVDDARLFA